MLAPFLMVLVLGPVSFAHIIAPPKQETRYFIEFPYSKYGNTVNTIALEKAPKKALKTKTKARISTLANLL